MKRQNGYKRASVAHSFQTNNFLSLPLHARVFPSSSHLIFTSFRPSLHINTSRSWRATTSTVHQSSIHSPRSPCLVSPSPPYALSLRPPSQSVATTISSPQPRSPAECGLPSEASRRASPWPYDDCHSKSAVALIFDLRLRDRIAHDLNFLLLPGTVCRPHQYGGQAPYRPSLRRGNGFNHQGRGRQLARGCCPVCGQGWGGGGGAGETR